MFLCKGKVRVKAQGHGLYRSTGPDHETQSQVQARLWSESHRVSILKTENVRPADYQFIVKVMPSTINLLMSLGNNRHFHCRGRVDYRVLVLVLFYVFYHKHV
jgi:hypothetical protein